MILIHGAAWLAVLFCVFFMLERLFRLHAVKKPLRSYLLDIKYFFLSQFYSPALNLLFLFFGWKALTEPHAAAAAQGPGAAALLCQMFLLLLACDCAIYLRHRLFHTARIWKFHSVHHSSEEVNWISAARFHPAESLIEVAGQIIIFAAFAALGAEPLVLAVSAFVIGVYDIMIHSNCDWTFGPFRYAFVSPVYHHWHHSDEARAHDKNFAAMFSFLDLAFGTFYMPNDSRPRPLGLSGREKETHPRTLSGQLLHPFRKKR
jgi:sterol desaturase/sphingolipid hydroxylase (fatty acid hydroxylase superfamily)